MFRKNKEVGQYVSMGRLSCPLRGDIDVDVCSTCTWFEDLSQDRAGRTQIRCRATREEARRPVTVVLGM